MQLLGSLLAAVAIVAATIAIVIGQIGAHHGTDRDDHGGDRTEQSEDHSGKGHEGTRFCHEARMPLVSRDPSWIGVAGQQLGRTRCSITARLAPSRGTSA